MRKGFHSARCAGSTSDLLLRKMSEIDRSSSDNCLPRPDHCSSCHRRESSRHEVTGNSSCAAGPMATRYRPLCRSPHALIARGLPTRARTAEFSATPEPRVRRPETRGDFPTHRQTRIFLIANTHPERNQMLSIRLPHQSEARSEHICRLRVRHKLPSATGTARLPKRPRPDRGRNDIQRVLPPGDPRSRERHRSQTIAAMRVALVSSLYCPASWYNLWRTGL